MNNDTAIDIQGVSKAYTLRTYAGSRPTRLGELIAQTVRRPFYRPSTSTFWALSDVNLRVDRGDVVGIIGHNGAGKSTLLKILSRITQPTKGRIELYGRVGSLLEVGTGFHPELTGRENIFLNGAILGMRRSEIRQAFDEIVDFASVADFLETPVKRYSSGMYVRLAFAVAAHLNPEILIVDEVLAVGDAEFQRKCLGKMHNVAQSGRTVLFVSHNMAAVRRLCSSACLMDAGRLVGFGKVADTIENYQKRMSGGGQGFKSVTTSSATLKDVKCNLEPNGDYTDLTLRVEGEVSRPIQHLGIGIEIATISGDPIFRALPKLTGADLGPKDGPFTAELRFPELNRYLSAGEYGMTISLHEMHAELLLRSENAVTFSNPEADTYGTGQPPRVTESGCVPLPVKLRNARELVASDA